MDITSWGELSSFVGTEIGSKYPTSFDKDLSLVNRRLQRGQIRLVRELKIEVTAEAIESRNEIYTLSTSW